LQLVVDNLWITFARVRHFAARHIVAGARASYARLRSRPLTFAT